MKVIQKFYLLVKSRPWISLSLGLILLAIILQLVSNQLPTPPTAPESIVVGESLKTDVLSSLGEPRINQPYYEHDTLFYPTADYIGDIKYFFDENEKLFLIQAGLPATKEQIETLNEYLNRLGLEKPLIRIGVPPSEDYFLYPILDQGVGVVSHEVSNNVSQYWYFQPGLTEQEFRTLFANFFLDIKTLSF